MTSTRDYNLSESELNVENCLVIFVVHSPPSSYIWSNAAACLVNIVFAIAGTILNSLVLFAFWKSPKLRSKLYYFAIMVLSSIDVLVTAIVHPLFLFKLINEILGTVECWHASTYYIALLILSGSSFSILLAISIERYLAIVHPIFHRRAVNKQTFLTACIVFCSVNVILTSIPFYAAFLSRIATVAVAIMCSTYTFTFLSIFRVARAKLREVRNREDPPGQEKSEMAFLRDVKMAKTLLAIVAIYVVCLLPGGVLLEMHSSWERSKRPTSSVVYVLVWINTLNMMISTLNCMAFFWGNREIRKEGIKTVKNCFSR